MDGHIPVPLNVEGHFIFWPIDFLYFGLRGVASISTRRSDKARERIKDCVSSASTS